MFESQWRQHIFSLLLKVYTEPVPTELHIQWVPVFISGGVKLATHLSLEPILRMNE